VSFPHMMENTNVNVYAFVRDMWVEWIIDRNFISQHFLLHQSGFQVLRNLELIANFTMLMIIMFLKPIDYVIRIYPYISDKQNI